MIRFEYKYFVAFEHREGKGHMAVVLSSRLNSEDKIKVLCDKLEIEQLYTDPIITNWKLLSFRVRFGG